MFTPKEIEDALSALGFALGVPDRDTAPVHGGRVERFTERLNVLVEAKPPTGAPPLTLAPLQARAVIQLLAPGWAMHSIKIAAYEKCVSFKQYAGMFLTPHAQAEIRDARAALKQIEYVLYALVELMPLVQVEKFVTFGTDLVPIYHHPQAMEYARELAEQWDDIPLRSEQRTLLN